MAGGVLGQTIGQISELTHLVPIRRGFLPAEAYPKPSEQNPEPVVRPLTYRLRLELLLAGLTKLEQRRFPTPVRRLGVIHAARWAIVEVGEGQARRPHLLFATQYDGSWHDYIKQFSSEVAPLMDMIWSNCENYHGASDFALLSEFVEAYQIRADALYVDAENLTVGEVRQLEERRRLALGLHVPAPDPSAPDLQLATTLFKKLEGVYPTELYLAARKLLLPWETELAAPLVVPDDEAVMTGAPDFADVQPHVVSPLDADTCVLFFVHFPGVAQARAALQALLQAQATGGSLVSGWNIGLSYRGLALLGLSGAELDQLGLEFRAGMRARAAWLGNRTTDYPRPDGRVHALFSAFAKATGCGDPERDSKDETALRRAIAEDFAAKGKNSGKRLHARLQALQTRIAEQLEQLTQGQLEIVETECLHRLLIKKGESERVYEYFGFEDGQRPATTWSAAQSRDDARRSLIDSPDPLLHHGTFLVVRKLEQDVLRFDRWAKKKPKLAELMMGRRRGGQPLGELDFRGDEQGKVCPFHSHVRRANPRTPESRMREMVRRGMSYLEPSGKRGLMFLAYNRNLADQFEFVQRNWIARGDGSRGFREDVDPILGAGGRAARFEYHEGDQRKSEELALEPFVKLRGGAYFFLPSLPALARLLVTKPEAPVEQVEQFSVIPSPACEDFWRELESDLDDPERSPAFWRQLGPGVHPRKHAVFVVGTEHARRVLSDDAAFSVREFGRRMDETTGKFFLGMDPVDEQGSVQGAEAATYWAQRRIGDAIIPMAGQRGRDLDDASYMQHVARAAHVSGAVLSAMRVLERPAAVNGEPANTFELHAGRFIAAVLGQLTGLYFGVEDPIDYKLTMWSSDVSLHVFRECPRHKVSQQAFVSGADFHAYVQELVQMHGKGLLGTGHVHTMLGQVLDKFHALETPQGTRAFPEEAQIVATLSGIVSGALATTASLFTQALRAFAVQGESPTFTLPDKDAGGALLEALREQGRSVPDRIYRVCRKQTQVGGVTLRPGTLVVVSQGSALSESELSWREEEITFFGHHQHHCPAERLALSIVDGAAQALAALGPLTVLDAQAEQFLVRLVPAT